MAHDFKISFSLEESDVAYFRKLFRNARKTAAEQDPSEIIAAVRALIARVREARKNPKFVTETVTVLEDLVRMIEDEDYELPKGPRAEVLAALSYFANPEDLIPDQVPGLGFLDDAIMIKIAEDEFRHELWGYRKFVKFRSGAEVRPWTTVAKQRLPQRLVEQRRQIRADVESRKRARPTSWW
jgi:uncharacterized membrane protein YkvA (DUF1232 family)